MLSSHDIRGGGGGRTWGGDLIVFNGPGPVKTDMASVAGNFCSHIGTVSQAAPAAM